MLAAGKRCAETGTAFGEGAAAIASTAASLVTVEQDPDRAAIAAERLAGVENVELLLGNWRDHLPSRAPFDFLFFDAAGWRKRRPRSTCLRREDCSSRTTSRRGGRAPIRSASSSSAIQNWLQSRS